MANRVIEKIKIDGEMLKQRIYNRGYSLRSLAKEIGISDRQIRTYLKKNEMPPYMVSKINKEINKNNFAAIVFVPICSRCQKPIKNGVSIDTHYSLFSHQVYPYMCINCDAAFTKIVTPNFDYIKETGDSVNMFDYIEELNN